MKPQAGLGVLGGYTTFSTYILDIHTLLEADRPGLALTYMAVIPISALAAGLSG
jgi:fluoride exporter